MLSSNPSVKGGTGYTVRFSLPSQSSQMPPLRSSNSSLTFMIFFCGVKIKTYLKLVAFVIEYSVSPGGLHSSLTRREGYRTANDEDENDNQRKRRCQNPPNVVFKTFAEVCEVCEIVICYAKSKNKR